MTNRHIVTVLGLWVALFAGCAAEMADDPPAPVVEKTDAALITRTPETFGAQFSDFTVDSVGGGTIQYHSFAKEFPGVRYSLAAGPTYYTYYPNYQDALLLTFAPGTPASLGTGCYKNLQVTVCLQLNNPYKDLLCWQFNRHDPTKPVLVQFVEYGSKNWVPWGYNYTTGQSSFPGITVQMKYVEQPFYGKCRNNDRVYKTYIRGPVAALKYITEAYTPDGAI